MLPETVEQAEIACRAAHQPPHRRKRRHPKVVQGFLGFFEAMDILDDNITRE